MREPTNLLLVGVGGQGILTLAYVIDLAAMKQGLEVKQTEVHGMSQRGGAVQAHLRISARAIHSPLIGHGEADLIIATEPLEAVRHLEYLAAEGTLVSSTSVVAGLSGAPPLDVVTGELGRVTGSALIDSVEIARSLGNHRAQNFVLLGAALPRLGLELDSVEAALAEAFRDKPAKVAQLNLAALAAGLELAEDSARSRTGSGT